jgi:hypothetical protein
MDIVFNLLMYCMAFGAMIVLFASLIASAFWLLTTVWRTAKQPSQATTHSQPATQTFPLPIHNNKNSRWAWAKAAARIQAL